MEITFVEAVPERLCDLLMKGELDVALLAKPDGFAAPFHPQPLYQERYVIACSAGHPFARKNVLRAADLDAQRYLARINCQYFDALRDACRANGSPMIGCFRREPEDWILTMVAAGMGVCFLPELSNTIPGVISRHVVDPEVAREVSLVTVAGRRWSSPVAAFVRAVKQYRWPEPANFVNPGASAWELVAAE